MRYGCVSPTPEMEDMDHSDSESSDASFEIVSHEGIDDSASTSPSFKPCVKFHDIFDVYPMDADVVARVSTSDDFKMSSDDKVVVVPLAWSSVDQAVCVSKLNGLYVRFDVNELPKAPADQFYQLCYCTAGGDVVGVSTPFFFREVHEEDLMEFQKEQNKEFWTFRSRFAVLTDLYWNAVKNNGTTRPDEMSRSVSAERACRPDEMSKSVSAEKICRPDEMSSSCRAEKDSEFTEKSSIESCSANKDSEAVDKSLIDSSSSSIQDTETLKISLLDCSANEASEMKDKSTAENVSASEASEITVKSSVENCSVIKDVESTEKVSTETEKKDAVQSQPALVDQEPTVAAPQVSKSPENELNDNARQKESKIVTDLPYNMFFNSGSRRTSDGYAKRFVDVGPWKLNVNDSFYRDDYLQAERIRLQREAMDSASRSLDRKIQDYRQNNESIRNRLLQIQLSDRKKDMMLMGVMAFRALPEPYIGQIILQAMNAIPMAELEKDRLLCEARRLSRYDEVWGRNYGNPQPPVVKMTKEPAGPPPALIHSFRHDEIWGHIYSNPKPPVVKMAKEPAGPVSQTILSLTKRIEAQSTLMQDLRRQLANESKTIDTLKGEYLTYKKEMESRLKQCAKNYAKLCLKLRQLSKGGPKDT